MHAHALCRQALEEPYAGEWLAKVKYAFPSAARGLSGKPEWAAFTSLFIDWVNGAVL